MSLPLPVPPEGSENHCYRVHDNFFILSVEADSLALQNVPYLGHRSGLGFFRVKHDSGDFPGGAVVKNLPANAGDMGSSPDPGRSHMPWSN